MKMLTRRLICLLTLTIVLLLVFSPVFADSQDVKGLNTGSSYYLRNASNEKYLQAHYITLSSVSFSDYSTANYNKWILERTNNGSYVIKSAANPSKVLTVSGNSVTVSSRNNNNTNQAFSIVRTTSALNAGTYKIKYGSLYLKRNGSSIVLSSSIDSYNACWSFEPCYHGNAAIYCFSYTGFDTTGAVNTFYHFAENKDYTYVYGKNKSAYAFYNNITTFDILLYRGHGQNACLCFYSSVGTDNGWIKPKSSDLNPNNAGNEFAINALGNNALSNARCILYLGCKTGLDNYYGNNLVDETFNRGAHFVLGTKKTIITWKGNVFSNAFFSLASRGRMVKECLQFAKQLSGIGQIKYLGDVHQRIG